MNHNQSAANAVKLTEFAKATGCSCKLSPTILQEILAGSGVQPPFQNLLVGNDHSDDAAVYLLDEQNALIATTDFFTPIVDEAFDYGRIAAANALSDVYAMGGKPIMALAILGWPIEQLEPTLAADVIAGAKTVCAGADIPLAGGHSIITTEPIFGLSVNGMVKVAQMKRNNTAQEGDLLLLTKPIGSGILTTARKRGLLNDADYPELLTQLTAINSVGSALGAINGVTAMTDITGFGLSGHLLEMAKGSNLSIALWWNKVPLMQPAKAYAKQNIAPDATFRNWNAVSGAVSFGPGVDVMESFSFLPDPQTNGGLLIAVSPASLAQVQDCLGAAGYESFLDPIGEMKALDDKLLTVLADG